MREPSPSRIGGRQHRDAAMAWRVRSYRGPRTGRRDTRVAREPERPCHFRRDCRPGFRLTNSRMIRSSVPSWRGRTEDETTVSPSEGNEVRRNEWQGVGTSRSTVEAGEPHRRDPVEERGCRFKQPLEGTMAGASEPVDVSTKQRRIADRVRDGIVPQRRFETRSRVR